MSSLNSDFFQNVTPLKDSHKIKMIEATPGQKSLWWLDNTLTQTECYNIPVLLSINTTLDINAMQKAVQILTNRYAILRTRFIFTNQILQQCIGGKGNVLFAHHKLSSTKTPNHIIKKMASTRLSLSDGPLVLITLLTTAEQTWLACCFHHIIVDAPSVRIILHELLQFYSVIIENREASLLNIEVTNKGFSDWQSSLLSSPESEGMRQYWKNLMNSAPQLTDLPIDFVRKDLENRNADYVSLTFSAEEVKKIKLHAIKFAMTPFMYLTMCWQFFLHRLTDQNDITIGIPFTLRDCSEFENIPGYMVNTLPLRVNISPDMTVKEFASHVKERFIGAHINKNIPFNEIVTFSKENIHQESPLFRTMLVMPDARECIFKDLPFNVKFNDYFSQAAKYDLTLFFEAQSKWKLVIEYRTALFHPQTLFYWLKLFRRLLVLMGQNSETDLTSISLLDKTLQDELIERSSQICATTPAMNFIESFNAYAQNHPERCALMTHSEERSYGWLARRSDQIATYLLRNFDICTGKRVALLLERNTEAIAVLLGVLKTGASYIPIDPQYPQERVNYMLQDAKVNCIATTVELSKILPKSVPFFLIDKLNENDAVCWHFVDRAPDDEFYIIYTSGSTGEPKGVKLLNKTLNNLIAWQATISQCSEGDCTLHYMSLSFDVSVQEIFSTLFCGGKLYIASEEERKDLHHLQEVIQERRIHRLYFPYVVLQQFAHLSYLSNKTFPHLKEVYSTGEQLVLTTDIKKFFKKSIRLINLYGPSESHVCSAYVLPSDSEHWGNSSPIGYPLPGFTLLVVDKWLRLVPAGVIGELLILSNFLSPGYHNKEKENSQRFISNYRLSTKNSYAYRSGDLVRLDNTNTFSYFGRIDSQLKIRGYRIEPSEVEATINALKGVQVSAVVNKEITPGNKQLIAFITGIVCNKKNEVLRQLRLHLPEYMIPRELIFLEKLPTTPSGKIDRKALLSFEIPVQYMASSLNERFTKTEKKVMEVWKILFPGRNFFLHDDFFVIGGHSLLATQLVFLLRKSFVIDISLRVLLNTPTISGMASSIDQYVNENKQTNIHPDKTFITDGYIRHVWPNLNITSTTNEGGMLLTGATGFLGIYLLRTLLKKSTQHVFCIIRGMSTKQAFARLHKKAQYYGIEHEIDFSRIHIYIGDIDKPNFGLIKKEYDMLSTCVGTVFHAAAHINFVLSYSSVKPTNVQGTLNIISFCGYSKRKTLNYISTIAVFSPYYPIQPILESYVPEYPESLSIGYTQSKWVAERYIIQAQEQGLNVNIFRIGRIGGDSRSGSCQTNDFLWRQIKSFIQMELAPEPAMLRTDILPVDFVSDAIVTLSFQHIQINHTYHIFHPNGTDFKPIYNAIQTLGYSIKITSEKVWLQHLENLVIKGQEIALGPVLHLFNEKSLDTGNNKYSNSFTSQQINMNGLSFPKITEETFLRMIIYFQRKGEIFFAKTLY